jgi:transposase
MLVEPFEKGDLAADSTGFSTKRYETWFTIRKGRRRAYTKLHTIIDLESLAILNIKVTKGTKHDPPILEDLIKHIPEGSGEFVADSAYSLRRNLIAKKCRTPYTKPKKNTRLKAKGSQTWRTMIKQYRESREEFNKHYQKRSRVESVISELKRIFGNNLTSRRRRSQRNELHLRAISYNIGITSLITIKGKERKSRSNFSATTRMESMMCIDASNDINLKVFGKVLLDAV